MKFGKSLQAEMVPEWAAHYIDYKGLKKVVKERMFESLCRTDDVTDLLGVNIVGSDVEIFLRKLEPQVQKVHKFFQSQLSIEQRNVTDLEAAVAAMSLQAPGGRVADPQGKIQGMLSQVGLLMLHVGHLEKFAHQNEEGLRKIVKKFNKILGTELLHDNFSRNCSFHRNARTIPLVTIKAGTCCINNTLQQLLPTFAVPSPRLELSRSLTEGEIDLPALQSHFHQPLKEAAKAFGVCVTVFKRICRSQGIKRWPARRVKMVQAKKAKLCKRIGIEQTAFDAIQPSGESDPTGEAMLHQLQQAFEEQIPAGKRRIKIWDKLNQRKLTGMAAPLEANLEEYLKKHPDREPYAGQDGQQSQRSDRSTDCGSVGLQADHLRSIVGANQNSANRETKHEMQIAEAAVELGKSLVETKLEARVSLTEPPNSSDVQALLASSPEAKPVSVTSYSPSLSSHSAVLAKCAPSPHNASAEHPAENICVEGLLDAVPKPHPDTQPDLPLLMDL